RRSTAIATPAAGTATAHKPAPLNTWESNTPRIAKRAIPTTEATSPKRIANPIHPRSPRVSCQRRLSKYIGAFRSPGEILRGNHSREQVCPKRSDNFADRIPWLRGRRSKEDPGRPAFEAGVAGARSNHFGHLSYRTGKWAMLAHFLVTIFGHTPHGSSSISIFSP